MANWIVKTLPILLVVLIDGGVIYISLQSAGIANQWLATADRADTGNNDGKLTKAEMQAFSLFCPGLWRGPSR